MADTSLVLSNVLCFLRNKYGKVALKTIKVTLTDFYSADKLSEAKFQLTQDMDMTNLSSHVLKRNPADVGMIMLVLLTGRHFISVFTVMTLIAF